MSVGNTRALDWTLDSIAGTDASEGEAPGGTRLIENMFAKHPTVYNSRASDFVEQSFGHCPHRFESCTQRSKKSAELAERLRRMT